MSMNHPCHKVVDDSPIRLKPIHRKISVQKEIAITYSHLLEYKIINTLIMIHKRFM